MTAKNCQGLLLLQLVKVEVSFTPGSPCYGEIYQWKQLGAPEAKAFWTVLPATFEDLKGCLPLKNSVPLFFKGGKKILLLSFINSTILGRYAQHPGTWGPTSWHFGMKTEEKNEYISGGWQHTHIKYQNLSYVDMKGSSSDTKQPQDTKRYENNGLETKG